MLLLFARNLDLNTPVERIDLHGQKVQEAYDMLVDLLGPHIKYRHKRESPLPGRISQAHSQSCS